MQNLSALPKWVVFILIAAGYIAFMLGKSLLTGEEIEFTRVVVTVILGFAVSAATFWIVRWQRVRESRKPPGYPTTSNFRSALASGRLPEGAKAEEWVPELVRTMSQDKSMAWFGPILFGALAGLGIFLINEHPDYPWFWVICTVCFAGIAVGYVMWIPRRRRQMEALISQFEANAGEDRDIR